MKNRSQEKCIIASVGCHLLLVALLVIGPAFLSAPVKSVTLPPDSPITFEPIKDFDDPAPGGGSSGGKVPPSLVRQQPVAVPLSLPTSATPPVQPRDPTPQSLEPRSGRKKPVISTNLVVRTSNPQNHPKMRTDPQVRADDLGPLLDGFDTTIKNIGTGMSGPTSIRLGGSNGGGSFDDAFLQAVKAKYEEAWIVPDAVTDDNATTGVSVTIARDGRVVTSRITRRSGNVEADRSVQQTLYRVKIAAPLPDAAQENQRTIDINFNVKAKRGLG